MPTYNEFSALKPEIIAGLVIKRAQQWGKLARFVPEELHNQALDWKYQKYDDSYAMPANENPPGTEARISEGEWTRTTVSAKPFRVKGFVDDWLQNWSIVDTVRQVSDTLVDKIQRIQEYRIIQHMTNFGQAAAGTTLAYYGAGTYPYMASKDKGANTGWDDATNGGKYAIGDLLEAKKWIAEHTWYDADTLLIGPDLEYHLLNSDTVRLASYYGGEGTTVFRDGRIMRLLGLDVIVLPGTYQTDNAPETETALIADRAIICHRGSNGLDLGILHVAENLTSKTYREESKRGDWIEVWKTFEPHIWREKCVVDVIDCVTPS